MDERSTRRGFLRVAAAAGVTSSAGCTQFGGLVAEDFPKTPTAEFRRNNRRDGYVPDKSVPEKVERQWRIAGINVGDHTASKSSPVPDGEGNVVVAGDTGEIHSFTSRGQLNWASATAPSAFGIHATPTVVGDTVFVGAYDGAMYAFDREDGSRKWRTRLGDAIGGSPAYHDGTIYVCVEYTDPSGALYALDATTGKVTFEDERITHQPHSTPGIDPDVGTLSVGANDGYLYTWHWPEMEFAWKFDAGKEIKSPIATFDGAAFFGSWDDAVFRVDLESGEPDWRFDVEESVMSAPGIDTDEGVVYVGGHDENVYALDATTGEELWRFETEGWVVSSVVVARQRVLVGSSDGYLYALDKDDGTRVWKAGNYGRITCEPLVQDGAIYYTERATNKATGGLYKLVPSE